MLTTTPFFRPRDGCVPMPMTLSAPSGVISATIATIFDVPMSRPTIRFLLPSPSVSPFSWHAASRLPVTVFFGGFSRKPGTRTAKPLR